MRLHRSAVSQEPSRVLYSIQPGQLIRIMPNLRAAIDDLVSSLLQEHIRAGFHTRHAATAYNSSTIALVIDVSDFPYPTNLFSLPSLPSSTSSASTFALPLRQIHLWLSNRVVAGRSSDVPEKISRQMRFIQERDPDLEVPFSCPIGWSGFGPRSTAADMFERMCQASQDVTAWRAFRSDRRGKLTTKRRKMIYLPGQDAAVDAQSSSIPGEISHSEETNDAESVGSERRNGDSSFEQVCIRILLECPSTNGPRSVATHPLCDRRLAVETQRWPHQDPRKSDAAVQHIPILAP
ncbi:MAG: hypothetical protein M1837_002495 [Sclerophora amabilis]|nr:MAG: hypothetical protein M1837_002495 [Sclerophora amabilis]